jgi:hypothetical protein
MRKPRPPRPSKLDPFKEQIKNWVTQDHCTNCEVIFARLQRMGYTGGISLLKEFVHPLRPAVAGHAPVQRYETKPAEQVQFYGFTAILGYSRMRCVTFVKRCDTPQTKGKVERTVSHVKQSLWAGITFTLEVSYSSRVTCNGGVMIHTVHLSEQTERRLTDITYSALESAQALSESWSSCSEPGASPFGRQGFLQAFTDANRDLYVCEVCDESGYYTIVEGNLRTDIDHYLPKSRYPHFACHPYYLIPICKACNQVVKGTKDPLEAPGRVD